MSWCGWKESANVEWQLNAVVIHLDRHGERCRAFIHRFPSRTTTLSTSLQHGENASHRRYASPLQMMDPLLDAFSTFIAQSPTCFSTSSFSFLFFGFLSSIYIDHDTTPACYCCCSCWMHASFQPFRLQSNLLKGSDQHHHAIGTNLLVSVDYWGPSSNAHIARFASRFSLLEKMITSRTLRTRLITGNWNPS